VDKAAVKAAIAKQLGAGVDAIAAVKELNGYTLTTFEAPSIKTETSELTTNFLQKRYFVKYTTVSGSTKFKVVNYVFYIYSEKEELLEVIETPSNSYKLLNLDADIIEAIGGETGTVLSYYHLVNGVLERIEAVDAEIRYAETLYVKAGDNYYLIDVTLLSEPGREYEMEIASGTSIDDIKTKMKETLGTTAIINEVKEKNGTGAAATWDEATAVTFEEGETKITKVYRVKFTKDDETSYYLFTFYFTKTATAS